MYESLATGRKIVLLLRRNQRKDGTEDGIEYTGFDICWEDGRPVDVRFARFCRSGIRLIFGRQRPEGDSFLVQFHLVPQPDPLAPRLALPRHIRPRRLYLERQGVAARMYLPSGEPTGFVFYPDDDHKVLEWVGFPRLERTGQQWFDLVALRESRLPVRSVAT
jgi:hypothetical protein